jgi:hypothetical protein
MCGDLWVVANIAPRFFADFQPGCRRTAVLSPASAAVSSGPLTVHISIHPVLKDLARCYLKWFLCMFLRTF